MKYKRRFGSLMMTIVIFLIASLLTTTAMGAHFCLGFFNLPNQMVNQYDDSNQLYYRSQLDEKHQQLYDTMRIALSNPTRFTASFVNLPDEEFFAISSAVWMDTPMFSQTLINLLDSYNYSPLVMTSLTETAENYSAFLDRSQQALNKAKEVVSEIPANWSDYQKVKYLHDYIAKNCVYNLETVIENHEAYGVLVLGKATCEGYSDAMQMMCNMLGLKNTVGWYSGLTKEDGTVINGHIWNIIEIDGENYHVDITADDNNYTVGDKDNYRPNDHLSYDSFGLTTEQYVRSFPKEVSFEPQLEAIMPKCNGTKYAFYPYNGLSFDTYDREAVASAMADFHKKARADGNKLTGVQFTNREAYDQALADISFFADAFYQISGISSKSYTSNSHQDSLVIEIAPN